MARRRLTPRFSTGLIVVMALPVAMVVAQSGPASVSEGVYTDEQAKRGQVAYEQECATCHRSDLLGDGIAPALAGPAFDKRWTELSAGDMFKAIQTKMPLGAPTSLSRAMYLDIVSYLLKRNEFPSGNRELPTDDSTLNKIIIGAKSPTR